MTLPLVGPRWKLSNQRLMLSNAVSGVLPERGQLVRVRDRHWMVVEILASTLPPSKDRDNGQADHLVILSSVDDDGLSDELRVFWELEGDARVLERATLPTPQRDRLDDPSRLAAFLDAVRWGAIASADGKALQAPFRSGITIEDYQLDPVVRALDMPRVNLLIADDVGLGKTIEAGLVAQEMLLRHRARTVIILCPPALRHKWRREMLEKFGLAFEIIDADKIRELRRRRGVGADPFRHFPRAILSFDWLKDGRPLEMLRATLPPDTNAYPRRFDLLIVDEVHQCAPSGDGVYATDSKRTKLLSLLAPHVEHRLFLSATPHNGYESSYSALLEMLDPQRFQRGVPPDAAALRRAVVRRMKAQIDADLGPKPDGSVRFPRRDVIALPVTYSEDERRAHADLATYADLRRSRARNRAKGDAAGEACDLMLLLLKKRLFSSPAAFATTLAAHVRTLAMSRPDRRPDRELVRAAYNDTDDDFALDDELDDATEEAMLVAARASDALAPDESALLDRLRKWSASAAKRSDAKAKVLVEKLRGWCLRERPSGKPAWTSERVIIFTEYRATQKWLHRILVDAGLAGDGGERLALMYGGMPDDDRERIVAEFGADPALRSVRILLATDTASEGIDLQRHCRLMLHAEIPFNPNRLEQRNGRIDRHGQPSPSVEIFHFIGANVDAAPGSLDADLEFLSRAARKVEQIRADLGGAGVVLAREVENAMLGRAADVDRAPSTSGARPRCAVSTANCATASSNSRAASIARSRNSASRRTRSRVPSNSGSNSAVRLRCAPSNYPPQCARRVLRFSRFRNSRGRGQAPRPISTTRFASGGSQSRSTRACANSATTSYTPTSAIHSSRRRCDCCAPRCGRRRTRRGSHASPEPSSPTTTSTSRRLSSMRDSSSQASTACVYTKNSLPRAVASARPPSRAIRSARRAASRARNASVRCRVTITSRSSTRGRVSSMP